MVRSRLVGLVVLGACAGGEDGGGAAHATSTVVPLLCTDGRAGEASCPVTEVPLDELGVTATFAFVVQPVDKGLFLWGLRVSAGASGVYLEHPRVIGWDADGPLPGSGGPFRDLILAVPPHTSQDAFGTAALVDGAASRLSLELAVVEPFGL